jgi:cysteinyl-tRNA synthetase
MLNIKRANSYPRATEYIQEMENMIDQLIQNNFAYNRRGSVYFRVSAFKSYGEFARMKFDDMIQGAGGSGPNQRRGQDDKESAQDFALWKSYSPQDLDVFWDSKFGKGRPGMIPSARASSLPVRLNLVL